MSSLELHITKRLAAKNLNPEKIPVGWLYIIMEGILEKSIVSVKTYITPKSGLVYVIEFYEKEDAKRIYDFCDGLLIEDTKEVFDLSFIPEHIKFDAPIDECLDNKGFQYQKPTSKAIDYDKMIDASEDEEIEEANEEPEEENDKDTTKKSNKKLDNKKEKPTVVKKKINLKEAVANEKSVDDLEGFELDMKDDRFSKIFNNPDFALDASNKKFKEQKESKKILDEMRKKYDENK